MRLGSFAVLIAALSGGCATITSSEYQAVSVSTYDKDGERLEKAQCRLSNDKGTWEVQTPGFVQVHRSGEDLLVHCRKTGHADGSARAISRVGAGMFGNIVFGGGVGAIIDHTKGTAYNYPETLAIRMGGSAIFDQRDDTVTASAAPLPASAAPAPAPAADTPQIATAEGVLAPGMPHPGDRWKYRYVDGYSNLERDTFVNEVVAVDAGRIDDRMTVSSSAAMADLKTFTSAAAVGLVERPLPKLQRSEFDPYLPALRPEILTGYGERIGAPSGSGTWTMNARVMGRELVVVPAGSFDAVKVVVSGERPGRSLISEPVRIEHVIWYAPKAKRYVRYDINAWNFNGAQLSKDRFELLELKVR